jgi:hypothetical protein
MLAVLLAIALERADAAATAGPAPAPTAAPVPAPASTEKPTLKEIGHVRALTSFCSAFERHFNAAVAPILENDRQIGSIGFTYGALESHFRQRAGELAVYDDRVHLMHWVDELQKLVPQAQVEVNDLRASASLAKDPADAKLAHELAAQLQHALDKQRQIAIDSLGIVQALGEATTSHVKTELTDVMPGGYDDYETRTPKAWRDVRSYLHWQSQLDRIDDAEGAAAASAGTLVARCE